jgi:arginyl-tRNA synthetase
MYQELDLVFLTVQESILEALKKFSASESENFEILIEPPNDPSFGELYTNAALAFAKSLKTSPKILTEAICESLKRNEKVLSVSNAPPGFINFRMKKEFWQETINEILIQKEQYSFSDLMNRTPINVEFVSANPTGPLHTGHARNAIFGDVLSNLLSKIGYKVTREFYINDRGNQVALLSKSVFLRYKELLGFEVLTSDFKEDMYCGEYIKDIAKELIETYGDKLLHEGEQETLQLLKDFSVKRLLKDIQDDLKRVGIAMDIYTSEAELHKRNMIEKALKTLEELGDIYEGVLPRPKGISDNEDWEERTQTLFCSTKYGDEIDRVVKKSDGTWTYFAGDLAYHFDKIERGYKRMTAVLGADHGGYVKRLKAAVKALSNNSVEIDIKLYQLVNFLENGKPIRMSKRAGNFITMREVIERVGKDVTRFMMISRHHDSIIDFDFVKTVEYSMDNPLFYIQYAYARICSVFRHYESIFGKLTEKELINCSKAELSDEAEVKLLQNLRLWPERVKSAAIALEPHRLAIYLRDIAHLFHILWNKGKTNAELRFISTDNKNETIVRLSLLQATKIILEDGFKLIGITPMAEMK